MRRGDSRMLWVTPGPVLPRDDGNRQRLYNLIVASAAAHQVTLLTPRLPAGATEQLEAVGVVVIEVSTPRGRGLNRFSAMRQGRPACLVPGEVAALERAAADLDGPFDLAFGPLSAAPAVMAAVARRHGLDDQNHELARYRSILAHEPRLTRRLPRLLDVIEVGRYERRWLRSADLITVCSEQDRNALTPLTRNIEVAVIPNGVDTETVTPAAAGRTPDGPPRFVFVGGLSYEPNVDACRVLVNHVMPEIWAGLPEAELWLVGKEPNAEVRAMASARVIVTGRVEDPQQFLTGAAATIVPLRSGGGTRLKILEAMAAGTPVVATPLAAAGLGLVDGSEAMIATDPATLAQRALTLAADPHLANRLTAAARERVVRDYDWAEVRRRFTALL